MVHLGNVIADTRRSRFYAHVCIYKRGVAKSSNRAEPTEYITYLSSRSGGLDGLYHCRREENTSNEGKCLVEFFSRPPSAGYRLQFCQICMKTGLEYL